MLVGLYSFFQYLHSIERGCELGADGCMTMKLFAADFLSASSRVASFHNLHLWMAVQELAALHQGHRMAVDFLDIAPVVVGQA